MCIYYNEGDEEQPVASIIIEDHSEQKSPEKSLDNIELDADSTSARHKMSSPQILDQESNDAIFSVDKSPQEFQVTIISRLFLKNSLLYS